jgi:signal transduction histidine kinase
MPTSYNFNLVSLSVVIAILAAYTALDLAGRVAMAKGLTRTGWLIGGAFSLGIGIWSMHFVGMLAFQLPIPVGYNRWIVVFSIIPAILASGLVLWITSRSTLSRPGLLGAGLLMGMGITLMHYTGMAAIQLPAILHYDWRWVAASAAVSMVISSIALRLTHHQQQTRGAWWQKGGTATLMGITIPMMHYVGMSGVHFSLIDPLPEQVPVLNTTWLASLISFVTLTILGLALILSSETKVYDRTQELSLALTQLQTTQAQMIQSEKMSSLGGLVAGVAHEINNPISFIHGNLTHVQDYTQNLLNLIHLYQAHYPNPIAEIQMETKAMDLEFIQADLPKILDSMSIGSDRIRQIVLLLRNFSRMDEADCKAVNIHDGIDSTLAILQHRWTDRTEAPTIQIIRDYHNLPPVKCYPSQLNQVFMNILANAIDALEEATYNQTYQPIEERPQQIRIQTAVVEANRVEITISDTGLGMSASIRKHIFDPFFTTKAVGKGTGLGLAIAHQIIVEKHGGTLTVDSTLGQGTTFTLRLPIGG